ARRGGREGPPRGVARPRRRGAVPHHRRARHRRRESAARRIDADVGDPLQGASRRVEGRDEPPAGRERPTPPRLPGGRLRSLARGPARRLRGARRDPGGGCLTGAPGGAGPCHPRADPSSDARPYPHVRRSLTRPAGGDRTRPRTGPRLALESAGDPAEPTAAGADQPRAALEGAGPRLRRVTGPPLQAVDRSLLATSKLGATDPLWRRRHVPSYVPPAILANVPAARGSAPRRTAALIVDVFASHLTAVGRNPRAASLRRGGGRERGGTPAPRLVEVGSGRLGRGRGPPRAPRAPHGALGAAGVGSAGGAACGRGRP